MSAPMGRDEVMTASTDDTLCAERTSSTNLYTEDELRIAAEASALYDQLKRVRGLGSGG
jgi:hypothetical protein